MLKILLGFGKVYKEWEMMIVPWGKIFISKASISTMNQENLTSCDNNFQTTSKSQITSLIYTYCIFKLFQCQHLFHNQLANISFSWFLSYMHLTSLIFILVNLFITLSPNNFIEQQESCDIFSQLKYVPGKSISTEAIRSSTKKLVKF